MAMVEKSLQPDVSVALLARNNGINDNLLFPVSAPYRDFCRQHVTHPLSSRTRSFLWWSNTRQRCCRRLLRHLQYRQSPGRSVRSPSVAPASNSPATSRRPCWQRWSEN
ncbi:hypothetical protein WEV50_000655 [Salmonella enterica]|nr:hypothetical protein [Salmonella enterica]EHG4291924.1 hypothetical protein [Salmonella enterica subsp. houtenae serovar 48:g,z51:-]EHM8758125.1 hypothetical protein [Salmonella enterica subsp. houtenae serovar 44:z36,[z38]:-]HCM1938537.1 hypothetical protein [Salmonella enterica subsp. houtenae serovar 57:z4,z23:-]HCM6269338.1 hypothetical protein [Salmonella enterica subsp. houtenae serovar 44:z36,Z38:-]